MSSQPVRKRYVPKKPNYYPAPPCEPNYYDAEPLDPHIVLIVRYLTVLLILATIMFGATSLYMNKYTKLIDPEVVFVYLWSDIFEFNNSTSTVTAKFEMAFNITNFNEAWSIYYNPALANVFYRGNRLGYELKTVTQMSYSRYSMTILVTVVDYNLTSNSADAGAGAGTGTVVSSLVDDWSHGFVPVDILLHNIFLYKKDTWPYFKTRKFEYIYECKGINIVYNTSDGSGEADYTKYCLLINDTTTDMYMYRNDYFY